ncbi:MAG: glycosyltransferase family A protein, partial [Candidatus Cybelea sp.]
MHSKSESKEDRTVTVAIPFARERIDFVRCALDSLLAQDHTNWRGIVLDDSPEGSAELASLVASYADLRLRYTRYDGPHGIGQAWNACLEAVETDLFSLLHTDDELEPWYISRMIRLAEQYPSAAMYFCRANIIDDQGSSCFSLADKIKDAITPNTEPVILTGADAIRSLA